MPRTKPSPDTDTVVTKRKGSGRHSPFKEEYYHLAEVAARKGMDQTGIAELLGVGPECISVWKSRDPAFAKVIKKGTEDYCGREIVKALVDRALGYEYDEVIEEFIVLRRDGEDDYYVERKETQGRNGSKHLNTKLVPGKKVRIVHKKMVPDVGAIVFYLCNRLKDEWANVQSQRIEGKVDHSHKVEGNVVLGLAGLGKEHLEQLQSIIADAERTGNKDVIDIQEDGRLRLGTGKPARVPKAALAHG